MCIYDVQDYLVLCIMLGHPSYLRINRAQIPYHLQLPDVSNRIGYVHLNTRNTLCQRNKHRNGANPEQKRMCRFLKEETKIKEKIFTKIPFCDKIVAKFYASLRTGAHHVVVVCLSPHVVNHI